MLFLPWLSTTHLKDGVLVEFRFPTYVISEGASTEFRTCVCVKNYSLHMHLPAGLHDRNWVQKRIHSLIMFTFSQYQETTIPSSNYNYNRLQILLRQPSISIFVCSQLGKEIISIHLVPFSVNLLLDLDLERCNSLSEKTPLC